MCHLFRRHCFQKNSRLNVVFDKLRVADLKLRHSLCELFRKEINYQGHAASTEGVSINPKKIQAVVEWPRPTTLIEVRSF